MPSASCRHAAGEKREAHNFAVQAAEVHQIGGVGGITIDAGAIAELDAAGASVQEHDEVNLALGIGQRTDGIDQIGDTGEGHVVGEIRRVGEVRGMEPVRRLRTTELVDGRAWHGHAITRRGHVHSHDLVVLRAALPVHAQNIDAGAGQRDGGTAARDIQTGRIIEARHERIRWQSTALVMALAPLSKVTRTRASKLPLTVRVARYAMSLVFQ